MKNRNINKKFKHGELYQVPIESIDKMFDNEVTRSVKCMVMASKYTPVGDNRVIIFYLLLNNNKTLVNKMSDKIMVSFDTSYGQGSVYESGFGHNETYAKEDYDEFIELTVPSTVSLMVDGYMMYLPLEVDIVIPVQNDEQVIIKSLNPRLEKVTFGGKVRTFEDNEKGPYTVLDKDPHFENDSEYVEAKNKVKKRYINLENNILEHPENYFNYELISTI